MTALTFATLSFNANNTPVSTQFDDIYFSTQDGLSESYYVFQEGNQLWEKWQTHAYSHFVIAETGFGTGLNFMAVADKFRQFRASHPDAELKRLYFISFEKYPLTAAQLAQIHLSYPQFADFSKQLTACWQPRQVGCERYHFNEVTLDLWFGDMTTNLIQLGDYHCQQIDCWFLDGFSPDKNPDMWSELLYQQMFRLTRCGGSFATFTAASHVRRGLQAVGFDVKKRKGFGKKREMLWGVKPLDSTPPPLRFPYFFQQNQEQNDDIAIIGGGVASLFVAWSLLLKGKRVTLYCQDHELAQNASGNLQGAIYPQLSDDDSRNVRFYVHSFDYARQRLNTLARHVHFEHAFSGVGLYAYNEKTEHKLHKLHSQGWDDLLQWLESDAFSQKVGISLPKGGAWLAQGGWISPKQLVQNGFAYLETLGLKLVLNHQVDALTWVTPYWQWQHNGTIVRHHNVILANGHCLKQFAQAEGIPLYPVRGQVSHIPTTQTLVNLKSVLCYDGYLTPSSATRCHCVGASHVRDNQEQHFSPEEHQQNLAKLLQNLAGCDWLTELDFSENLGKVGIRSALRDRMPIVGAMPDFPTQSTQYHNLYNKLHRKENIETAQCYPSLYLIAGLGSRGLTTAPLLGEILAALICREPLPLSEDLWHVITTNRSWMRCWLKGKGYYHKG